MHVRPITAIPPVQTRARYYKTAHLTPFHTQPARQPKTGGVVPSNKQRRKRPDQNGPLTRPKCSLVEAIRQQEAHPGRRGRGGCLVHSGDNHWLVMKRWWSLKMLKAIVHCSDHCTSSSNHVVECVRRVIAHGGRQAKHSQPWRFARRRFVGHIFASGEKCVEIGSCGGAYTDHM